MQKLSNKIILEYVPTVHFEPNTQKTKEKKKEKKPPKRKKKKKTQNNTGSVNVFKPCG